jgi:ubiquinone/menaquinone biosynthesis C-methylase UbiE
MEIFMPRFANNNPNYLLNDQYKTGSNLNSRVQLHERFSTNKYGWHRWLFDQLDIAPNAKILELGCGTGKFWQTNSDRIPPEWDLTLSDFSTGMLETAKSELEMSERNFSWRVIDAENIPYKDSTFNAVIASHMLYHVPNRTQALSEIRRILTDHGHLYATTNGRVHMKELDDLVQDAAFKDDTVDKFGLENGAAQLMPFFNSVALKTYQDSLAVTDTDTVIRYLLSADGQHILSDEHIDGIRKFVQAEIVSKGSFHITKASGLFSCQPKVCAEH